MTITLPGLSGAVLVYLLVFARTGAMVMFLPAIGDANVPSRVRLILALAIALALAPTVEGAYPQTAPATMLVLGALIAKEITIGLLIGAITRIIISSVSIAGFLIASQTGLSYSQTIDPSSQGQQGVVVGNFLSLLATVLIFATNLHHLAIGAIAGSYHLIPPGTELPTGDMAELAIRITSGSFALGFQLAAPFLVFGFAVNAAFGMLARMMPQLQVFFVAAPVNILVGFMVMALMLGSMMTLFLDYYAGQMGQFL